MLSDIWQRIGNNWLIRTVGNVARAAGSALAGVAGPIVADAFTLVSDAVDAIVEFVLTPVRKAWDFLAPHLNNLADALADAVAAAYSGLRWIDRIALPAVQRFVLSKLDAVGRLALAGRDWLFRWASDRLAEIRRTAIGFGRWVREEVLVPLWNGVNGLRRWATDRLGELVAGLASLGSWIRDVALPALWSEVLGIGRFIVDRVLQVVVLFEAALEVFLVIQREGTAGLLALLLPGKIGLHFRRMTNASGREGRDMLASLDDWADVWLR